LTFAISFIAHSSSGNLIGSNYYDNIHQVTYHWTLCCTI